MFICLIVDFTKRLYAAFIYACNELSKEIKNVSFAFHMMEILSKVYFACEG